MRKRDPLSGANSPSTRAVIALSNHKGGRGRGAEATSELDLHNPSLEWIKLANGMGGEAVRVDTSRGCSEAFKSALTNQQKAVPDRSLV